MYRRKLQWLRSMGPVLVLLVTVVMPRAHAGSPADPESIGVAGEFTETRVRCAFERLGVRWARVVFRWASIERLPGVYDWTVPDQIVESAMSLGLDLIVTIEDAPGWANGNRPPNFPPTDVDSWTRFVEQLVMRYTNYKNTGYSIRAWGIWNEPNLPVFFRGDQNDYVHRLLIPAARVIHQRQPDGRVVGPEFSWHWILDLRRWNLLELLRGEGGSHLDVVSLHIWEDVPGGLERYLDLLIRPILEQAGWVGKPFWLTEVGYMTCSEPCNDDAQAHFIARAVRAQQLRQSWLQKIFFFSVFIDDPCVSFVRQDFSCDNWSVRPAYWTLLNLLRGEPLTEFAPQCHVRDLCSPFPNFFFGFPLKEPGRGFTPPTSCSGN